MGEVIRVDITLNKKVNVFLAFFSVVASYSNLSTVFNGCKDKLYFLTSLHFVSSLTLEY